MSLEIVTKTFDTLGTQIRETLCQVHVSLCRHNFVPTEVLNRGLLQYADTEMGSAEKARASRLPGNI